MYGRPPSRVKVCAASVWPVERAHCSGDGATSGRTSSETFGWLRPDRGTVRTGPVSPPRDSPRRWLDENRRKAPVPARPPGVPRHPSSPQRMRKCSGSPGAAIASGTRIWRRHCCADRSTTRGSRDSSTNSCPRETRRSKSATRYGTSCAGLPRYRAELTRAVTALPAVSRWPAAGNSLVHRCLADLLLHPQGSVRTRGLTDQVMRGGVVFYAPRAWRRARAEFLRARLLTALTEEVRHRRRHPADEPRDVLDALLRACPPTEVTDRTLAELHLMMYRAVVVPISASLAWSVLLGCLHHTSDAPWPWPADQVVREALRYRPVPWLLGRTVPHAVELGGVAFRPGDLLSASPYLMHHEKGRWTAPRRVPARTLGGAGRTRLLRTVRRGPLHLCRRGGGADAADRVAERAHPRPPSDRDRRRHPRGHLRRQCSATVRPPPHPMPRGNRAREGREVSSHGRIDATHLQQQARPPLVLVLSATAMTARKPAPASGPSRAGQGAAQL